MESTGWSSPTWRWGSAVGDAHDKAMQVRQKFNTEEKRESFLKRIALVGSRYDTAAVEELKLTLALCIQWCGHCGIRESNGHAWRDIEANLVSAKYECERGIDVLKNDLLKYCNNGGGGGGGGGADEEDVIVRALKKLNFVTNGC